MPRPPRYDAIDIPQHIVQRGNNRQPTFFDDRDRARYLGWLGRAATEATCDIHAYVLMSNHVHLLATPRRPMAIAALMQSLGRRYVRYFNVRRGRTGTLWEGRYRACLVTSASYLLTCYRYIELNPVRAGMVDDPARHLWSSFHRNALGSPNSLITEHGEYTALATSGPERLQAYRELFEKELPRETIDLIRRDLNRSKSGNAV